MVLKGKKLHPDGVPGIKSFVIAYKDLTTLKMTYKELTLFNSMSCDLCLCCHMQQRVMSMDQSKCILCLLHIFILVVL
jgi:hypothetical protein